MEGVVVDQMFDMSLCVPETFAIKVESCQKSRRNFDIFLAFPNFWRRAFQKLYERYHPCLAARHLEKFLEDTPSLPLARSPKVMRAHIFFFGGGGIRDPLLLVKTFTFKPGAHRSALQLLIRLFHVRFITCTYNESRIVKQDANITAFIFSDLYINTGLI